MSEVSSFWIDIAYETAWNGGEYDCDAMEEIAQSAGCTVDQLVSALEARE